MIDDGDDYLRDRWREKYYDKCTELNTAEAQLDAARNENEELMKADYWQDRHNIVVRENEKLRAALTKALDEFGLIGGMTQCKSTTDRINADDGITVIIRAALSKDTENE